MPDFVREQQCGGFVAGVDEVGRGPLAGPVLAAAVIFENGVDSQLAPVLNDSKKMSRSARDKSFALLMNRPDVKIGVGAAGVAEIDHHNIFQASFMAMQRAIRQLPYVPDHALIDGKFAPRLPCPSTCLIKGDSLSYSISAASIIAKVIRDRLMVQLAEKWPVYQWHKNMGYGTKDHKQALERYGPCIHHRKSFAPIKQSIMKTIVPIKKAAAQLCQQ
ncbi:ribonuclease HII [Entomobacter blattae]|uniref:Ribonuclease HII n=1 Tax=Entomobacter blattae TaxID=2762277 RepID=A0A7H1NND3_9PROT|nr:ribonuclease HII [Entomobacter blattae]QNT77293.1 Ribonuclease HII [Entomobacter blattae]